LPHGPIAHRVGAAGPGCRHATEGGIRAGIDWEEKTTVTQIFIQLLARDARLDAAVKVLPIDLQDGIHSAEVDANPALQRRDVPFEGSSCSKGHDRRLVGGAERHDLCNLLVRFRKSHRIGRRARMEAYVLAMLFTHGQGGRKTVSQKLLESVEQIVLKASCQAHSCVLSLYGRL